LLIKLDVSLVFARIVAAAVVLHPLCILQINRTNFGGILHHGARARKQKTLKILCFVICVEDYHKLTQT
jgi:hypothetical protein